MELHELAQQLVSADAVTRGALLRRYAPQAGAPLAYCLKDLCLDGWSSDPARTFGAAAAARLVAQRTGDAECAALSAWCDGLAALVKGHMEEALTHLDESEKGFLAFAKPQTAAATQISKLIALATLGRYDEAVVVGQRARAVLLAHGDSQAAGKIEHNIGNIYWRRDLYREAEEYFTAARARFLPLQDDRQLALIENCLAYIEALKHNFRAAEELYQLALDRAVAAQQPATQAAIEANIGNLALFQGRYGRALDYLERARRKFVELGLDYRSALSTEAEIADAYLEMNLLPEARKIYERILPLMAESGAHWERARALVNHSQALLQLQHTERAADALTQARALYESEGNAVGAAQVKLIEAQLCYAQGRYADAARAAREAAAPLHQGGAWRSWLLARWLQGNALRRKGSLSEAQTLLTETLTEAQAQEQPNITHRCHTALGLLAASQDQTATAQEHFRRAVNVIENLRAPLPAEEFRAAFFADKLTPYNELVRLCLASGDVRDAFAYTEQARARALADVLLDGVNITHDDTFAARLAELHAELNWCYSRMNRLVTSDEARRAEEMAQLRTAAQTREREILELTRQLQHRQSNTATSAQTFSVEQLQAVLGADTALVEYLWLDDECLAFVVTGERLEVARNLCAEKQIRGWLERFRWQNRALRYGREEIGKHLPQLTQRAQAVLSALYNLLLAPLESHLGARRVVFVPHGVLHYVPFHALYDGTQYAIERREISYAPSAKVFLHCLAAPPRPLERGLFVGVPDARAPSVLDEAQSLARLFDAPTVLLDSDATPAAVAQHAPSHDLLHFACHAGFRPDSPLFSALHLAGGNLTVLDVAQWRLKCSLVTLSACDTGLSHIAPGDELTGLARGFFAAGAPALLLSLWSVDDIAATELMGRFYMRLQSRDAPAKALRNVQLAMLAAYQHPYYWAPFVLMGRGV